MLHDNIRIPTSVAFPSIPLYKSSPIKMDCVLCMTNEHTVVNVSINIHIVYMSPAVTYYMCASCTF